MKVWMWVALGLAVVAVLGYLIYRKQEKEKELEMQRIRAATNPPPAGTGNVLGTIVGIAQQTGLIKPTTTA